MFELRLQDAEAGRDGTIEGSPLGRFLTYAEALTALDAEQERLASQLLANGEGATALRLQTAVVEVEQDGETAWLWSSYKPGAASSEG
jgi:hypothetical protein